MSTAAAFNGLLRHSDHVHPTRAAALTSPVPPPLLHQAMRMSGGSGGRLATLWCTLSCGAGQMLWSLHRSRVRLNAGVCYHLLHARVAEPFEPGFAACTRAAGCVDLSPFLASLVLLAMLSASRLLPALPALQPTRWPRRPTACATIW